METFFEQLFVKMPDWFFIISSIIILTGLVAVTTWAVLGTKKFADSLGKEKKLYDLQENIHNLEVENKSNKDVSSKLHTVIDNSRLFINTINHNGFDGLQIHTNIQRIIESLSADVKTNTGEKHRCGLWIKNEEEKQLLLIQGSSGFPDHYIHERALGIDTSIAGRCFRKKITINCPDVNDDHDFDSSEHKYVSLICIPIQEIGVLTVDGISPFEDNAVSIAELYASIIELLFNQLINENIHKNKTNETNVEKQLTSQ